MPEDLDVTPPASDVTPKEPPVVDPPAGDHPIAEPPAYEPNYKFKVMDKEQEFDEWVRSSIKDAETEKKARELFEKAHGLDHVKPKYQKTREELTSTQKTHNELVGNINRVMAYKKNRDYDTFFKELQLDPKEVYRWVLDKINYSEMQPEQRAQFDEQAALRTRTSELELQNRNLQQNWEQDAVQARMGLLDQELAKPEVQSVLQVFDARLGTQGAFRNEIIRRAATHYNLTQEDLTPQQAVAEMLKILGPVTPAAPQVPPGVPPSQNGGQKPPVIPSVPGRSASPTRKVSKSTDDLRKLAAELAEKENAA